MLVSWVWQLCCIETLHLLGYLMTAAMLKDTAKGMLYNATLFLSYLLLSSLLLFVLESSDWRFRVHLYIFLFSVFYIRILLTECIVVTGSLSVFLIMKLSSTWFKLAVCYIVSSDTMIFPSFLQGQLILHGTWNKYPANVLMANRMKLHYILFQEDCLCSNSRGTHECCVVWGQNYYECFLASTCPWSCPVWLSYMGNCKPNNSKSEWNNCRIEGKPSLFTKNLNTRM